MITAKGAALRATLDFIEREAGAASCAKVLAKLKKKERAAIEAATATDEVPFVLLLTLWRAADAAIGKTHPDWIEQAGAYSIESSGMQLYAGIVKKSSPTEFLTQPVKLFRLYYRGGDMEVVEQRDGRAVLRLVGFDESDRLFCRRQTGGLRRALELAGGEDTRVRHVRCALEGDAFCEWELAWRAG